MYVQVITRPDITFAVNIDSRMLDKPISAHWRLVKRIIRYVKNRKDIGLYYKTINKFECFSDADFAGD